MSLYGALFAGVSGLKSQGNKLAVVSDNIANVNTVGYKAGQATFETLVTNSGLASQYTAGGVLGGNRQLVDKQGQIVATEAPSDIAIRGGGFFIVSSAVTGAGQPLYTRAGSFRQDSLGNLVNAQGFYLRGWPLDRNGRLPGEVGNVNTTSSANLDSLTTINVESGSGVAAATTSVEIGANLNAGDRVFPGAGEIVDMDIFSPNNFQRTADSIIVSNDYGAATANNVRRGDSITVSTQSGLSYTYLYGGFTVSRDISTNANGDSALGSTNPMTGGTITTANGSNTITMNTGAAHNLGPTGSTRTIVIAGVVGGNLPGGTTLGAANINGTRTVTITGANTFTFTTTSLEGGPGGTGAAMAAAQTFDDFAGNILDSSSASGPFLSQNSITQFTASARSFTIANTNGTTSTFTYVSSSPSSVAGQFNNLNTLAAAINEVVGLTARVVNNRLYVSAEDATQGLTFANGDATGAGTLGGINWVRELGLTNVTATANRFNTQAGLAALVNASVGLDATTTNPLSTATTLINVEDPLDQIRFRDTVGTAVSLPNSLTVPAGGPGAVTVTIAYPGHALNVGQNIVIAGSTGGGGLTPAQVNGTRTITAVVPGVSISFSVTPGVAIPGGAGVGGPLTVATTNVGSVLAELGIVASLNGGAYVAGDTGLRGPAYDASGAVGRNMASGNIVAQFSRNVRVYDALGAGHDVRLSFIKIASNRWAVEAHVVPPTDITPAAGKVNGQIAVGTIEFNGDGSLRSVSSELTNQVTINWTNGAVASQITFDWGTPGSPFGTAGATTIGRTDGLSQFNAAYNLNFLNQNGSPVGELVGINFDEDGFVIASYSNGETQRIYKLAIADFNNPNGLQTISGNVFAQTESSGEVNLREAGRNGVGKVAPSSLESSNVDLSEQLTDMIVAQRAYQANTRVITTTDRLLEELNNIVR